MSTSNEVNYSLDLREPMSVGNYLVMFLLMAIPIVNVILLFIWAFGGNVNQNKKNCALALLIMMAISIALSVMLGGLLATMLGVIFEGMG